MDFPTIILVPTNFTPASEHALLFALDLAKLTDASVHVVHVYQLPLYAFPEGSYIPSAEDASYLANIAEERLVAELTHLHAFERVYPAVRMGVTIEEICAYADEIHADLIVLGTHPRTGIERILLGSTAKGVVRLAKQPVLVVPFDQTQRQSAQAA